jgi:hypothetical protein
MGCIAPGHIRFHTLRVSATESVFRNSHFHVQKCAIREPVVCAARRVTRSPKAKGSFFISSCKRNSNLLARARRCIVQHHGQGDLTEVEVWSTDALLDDLVGLSIVVCHM